MKNSTAIKMIDGTSSKSRKPVAKKTIRHRLPEEIMESELHRFLKKISRNIEFNERQLSLPGLFAE